MSETTTAPTTTEAAAAEPAPLGNVLADAAPATDTPAAAPTEQAPADAGPVEYKDFKLPEGIKADDAFVKLGTEELGKLGLPQDKAEALVAAVAPQIAEQLAAPYKAWEKTQAEWQGQIKADPDYGGDKLNTTLVGIAKVIDQFGGNTLRDALVATGAGNNPAIFRAFAAIASHLTEGTHVSGNVPQTRDVLADMYPSMRPSGG